MALHKIKVSILYYIRHLIFRVSTMLDILTSMQLTESTFPFSDLTSALFESVGFIKIAIFVWRADVPATEKLRMLGFEGRV